MRLGIDASNLRIGGGVTHLVELLRAARPERHNFERVHLWAGTATAGQVEDRPWLTKHTPSALDGGVARRAWWQRFELSDVARDAECDVLLVPGGTYAGNFRPVVTMSRNMVPFEWREMRRWRWTPMLLRLLALRRVQTRTFRAADGLVFLTQYARAAVTRATGPGRGRTAIVPHGVDERFVRPPRPQLPLTAYSAERPFRLVYVSIVDLYKHQWHVAEAVARLRNRGIPVTVDFVGPAYPPALKRLRAVLDRVDPAGCAVRYLGPLAHDALPALYAAADGCVFASSCENMPNILLEGMAAGLPIACSDRGPMPEVLGDGGVYCDPEDAASIERALGRLLASPELRARVAEVAYARSRAYSWTRCADETFAFLRDIAASSDAHAVAPAPAGALAA